MQINDFSGGLNLRLDPSLIGINESVVCNNVDTSRGSLVPIKDKSLVVGQAIGRYATYFNANQEWVWSDAERSYVEYRDNLYYSTYDEASPEALQVYDGVTHKPFGLSLDTNTYTKVVTEQFTDPEFDNSAIDWGVSSELRDGENVGLVVYSPSDIASQTFSTPPGVPLLFSFRFDNPTSQTYFRIRTEAGGTVLYEIYGIVGRHVEVPYTFEFISPCVSLYIEVLCNGGTTYIYSLSAKTPSEDYNVQLSQNYSFSDMDLSGGWSLTGTTTSDNSAAHYGTISILSSDGAIQKDIDAIVGKPLQVKIKYLNLDNSDIEVVISDNSGLQEATYTIIPDSGYTGGPAIVYLPFTPLLPTFNVLCRFYYSSTQYSFTVYEIGAVITEIIPKTALTLYNSTTGIESTPRYDATQYTQPEHKLSWSYNTSPSIYGDVVRLFVRDSITGIYNLYIELDTITTEYFIPTSYTPNLGVTLDTTTRDLPPLNSRYLLEAYGRLFAANEHKVYFSNIADLEYWSALNYIEFDDTITGLATLYNGLLVMTSNTCFLLSGDSPANFVKTTLSKAVGCISHFSISYLDNHVIWLSDEGLMTTSGGTIINLSYDKLGHMEDFKFGGVFAQTYAAASQTNYYLSFTQTDKFGDHAILVYNKLNKKFSIFSNYGDACYTKDGDLYTSIGASLYKAEAGNNANIEYISGELSEGSITNTKIYTGVDIAYIGDITVTFYINNIEILVKALSSINIAIAEIKLPQATQRGNTIRYKITGSGSVYEVEYKVKGEEN